MPSAFFLVCEVSRKDRAFGTLSLQKGLVMKLLICVLGLVLIVEGLPYFAFPGKMKKWMSSIQEIPDQYLRAVGFAAMCAGLILAYLSRQ